MTKGLPMHWRLIPQRYNLLGSKCETCSTHFFPQRQVCPNCRRKGKLSEVAYSGRGKIFSYTVVHAAPRGFEFKKPYVLAIVELEEGPKVTTQIVDCNPGEIEIGTPVKLVFRLIEARGKEDIIKYGYKFKVERN